MNLKLDENLPPGAVALLRDSGHDAESVNSQNMRGANDAVLIARCRTEERILVTLDMGFSDIRTYPPTEHAGIVVIRSAILDRETILGLVRTLAEAMKTESPVNRLWILERTRLRIRG